jgi:hypothetical protein
MFSHVQCSPVGCGVAKPASVLRRASTRRAAAPSRASDPPRRPRRVWPRRLKRPRRMRPGCGAQLTGRNMRAHFTICPERLAASDQVDRRVRNSNPSADDHRDGDCRAVGAVTPSSRRARCGRVPRGGGYAAVWVVHRVSPAPASPFFSCTDCGSGSDGRIWQIWALTSRNSLCRTWYLRNSSISRSALRTAAGLGRDSVTVFP